MDRRAKAKKLAHSNEHGRGLGTFFVGREKEIGRIARELEERIALTREQKRLKKDGRDAPGHARGILLITAPPGTGKTALLDKTRLDLKTRIARGSRFRLKPLIVETHAGNIQSEEDLRRLCAEEAERNQPVFRNLCGLAHTVLTAIKMKDAARKFECSGNFRLAKRPAIVLMVDEIQNTDRTNGRIWESLHLGNYRQLPIAPVFAGLSDSMQVLREQAKISRIEEKMRIRLNLIDDREAAQAVAETLEEVDTQAAPWEKWKQAVEEDTLSFPRHLVSMNVELLEYIAETGKEALDASDLEQIRHRTANRKREYYDSRYEGVSEEMGLTACRVLIELDERKSAPSLVTIAQPLVEEAKHLEEDPERAEREAKKLAREMIHAGMAHIDEKRNYGPGIPSFVEWARAKLEENGQPPGEPQRAPPQAG